MLSEDPNRPGSMFPPAFEPLPGPCPTRAEPLLGRITLWPKAGSVATCAGIAVFWIYLMFSGAVSGDGFLSRLAAPFGLSLPYPLIATAACWIAIGAFAWPLFNILSAQVAFDGEGLYFADGLLSREQTTWHVSRIETVEVFSSLWGRIFGYGSLRVAATGGSELWVLGLRRPRDFAQAILNAQARDAARLRGPDPRASL